ncbi:MAG: hypothetical protein IJG13_10645 [Kiritimatiellae bacterium]|nr:hypothetical protein [Kiritimatiellia bacterium]
MIENAFRRKLSPYARHFQDKDGEGRDPFADVDFAQEFDGALAEYEVGERYKKGHHGEAGYLRKAKAWKDDVWAAVAKSDDPPLKVIIGKLLGHTGVINQVVEEWLLTNYSAHFKGEGMLVLDKSRDAETHEKADDSGVEGFELVAMNAISPDKAVEAETEDEWTSDDGESINVPAQWIEELEKALSPRMCCLVLANVNGIKIYADNDVLSALGVGKTTAANELKKLEDDPMAILGRLNAELREWLLIDASGTKYFLRWIKKRCQLEKAGDIILSRIALKEKTAE